MKRIILAALLLTLFQHYASAQADSVIHDTLTHRYARFYYPSWYDTCPDFLDSNMKLVNNLTVNVFANIFHTPEPMAVKGLAAMVMMETALPTISTVEVFYSPDNGFRPEYLSLWQDSGSVMRLATDSVRVDTVIPRLLRNPLTARDTSQYALCLIYEVFFDKPVIVDSTFAVGGTENSNRHVWLDEYNIYVMYYMRWYYASITDARPINNEYNSLVYCHNPSYQTYINPSTGYHSPCTFYDDRYWGPFFAIADFYNLTVISSDTALGTVDGSGRFTDYVPRTISATPKPGYWFRRWNDGNTHNPRTVFLTQDTLFTDFFTDSIPLRLTAQPNRSFQGQVTGSGNYWPYDTATLTATPNDNYRFTHWNDGDTNSTRIVVVTQDTTFTAFFEWFDQHEGISAPDSQAPLFTLSPNPARNSVTVTLNSQFSTLNYQSPSPTLQAASSSPSKCNSPSSPSPSANTPPAPTSSPSAHPTPPPPSASSSSSRYIHTNCHLMRHELMAIRWQFVFY